MAAKVEMSGLIGRHHKKDEPLDIGRDARYPRVMDKPTPPQTRTWSFSFSMTRADPDGAGETALSWAKRLTVLDVTLIVAGLVLFIVEPFAVAMFLNHHKAPPSIESCASIHGSRVIVSHTDGGGPGDLSANSAPGDPYGHPGDVITPLNVRDPSSLVMSPGR